MKNSTNFYKYTTVEGKHLHIFINVQQLMEKIFKILSKALQEKNPKEIILCDKVNGTLKLNNKTFNGKNMYTYYRQ